jgi:PelA/Pel-15E family pectate lyase
VVDYTREGEERNFYRHNADSDDPALKQGRNQGTFDDNTSQASLRMLMDTDAALEGADAEIHEAAMAGLEWVLESQYTHGGFPQRYPLSDRGYSRYSTYNDNNMYYIMHLLMAAYEQYGDERYEQALLELGDFFINSQMPEPQPIWAQQYDEDLRPAWARRFEPPSVTGGETQGVMNCLISMALYTKDEKFLAPIPPALAWYNRSALPDGNWARFYELKTNKPLYFTSNDRTTYRLTYDDSDCPDHYSFKGGRYPQAVENAYNAIQEQGLEAYAAAQEPKELTAEELRARAEGYEEGVRQTLAAQTEKGVWVTTSGDQRIISMRTVQGQMRTLSRYLAAANGKQ